MSAKNQASYLCLCLSHSGWLLPGRREISESQHAVPQSPGCPVRPELLQQLKQQHARTGSMELTLSIFVSHFLLLFAKPVCAYAQAAHEG